MEERKKANEKQNGKWSRISVIGITAMMLGGNICAFYRTMAGIENRIQITWLIVFSLAGMIGCEAAWKLKKIGKSRWIMIMIPWLAALAATGFRGYFAGMKAWINGMIHMWNQIHEGGVALFGGSMTAQDVRAFGIIMAVLTGQLIWFLVTERHLALAWIWEIVWVSLMILCGEFSALACGLLFCGLLAMYIGGRELQMNRTALGWMCAILAACAAGIVLIPKGDMPSVERMREQTKKKVYELRYGEEKLPAGDLSKADTFQKDTRKMLTVTSAQEKTLYIKAFVGGIYRDGSWENMPASEYGGTDAGMLQWLKKKNFDPLTQSARYYQIGDGSDMEENKIAISVSGGSRDYFYSTDTLKNVLTGKKKELKDYGLKTTGLTGEREYTFSEISSTKPAELTVADPWVQNPKTKKQKEYKEAEAVYRDFVYEHYTTVDKKMYNIVNDIFWKDYNSKSDGIYSALTQIRNKLKEEYTYTKTPQTGNNEDTLKWFLEDSHSGNSMLYASAAVEAFRAHGIPARYVEGYYVPATAISSSEDGYVLLSGEDMHAWTEVYFDGIGWLPVDVTPGYYYDAATLQKMVNTPDQVQKNAALKDNSFGGKQTSGLEGTRKKVQKEVKKQIKNVTALILGIVAVLIVCLTIWIVILEAGELIMLLRLGRRYRCARGMDKIAILEQEIFLVLQCMGLEARLGWKVKETDQKLQEMFEEAEHGEYIRVCALLEKQLYGESELEPFEERTVKHYLGKLLQEGRSCDFRIRWKIHQRHFGFTIMNR